MLFRRSEGPLLAQHLSLFEGEGRNGKIPASFRVGTLRQVRNWIKVDDQTNDEL